MSIFERSVTCSFFQECYSQIDKYSGEKFEDMFLVKIADKGTSLNEETMEVAMTHDINNLCHISCARKNLQSSKLPPTEDSVKLHPGYRANYQSYIWKNFTARFLVMQSPEGNGWIKDEDRMPIPESMRNQPAPGKLAELAVCHCKQRVSEEQLPMLKIWVALHRQL